MSESDMNMHLPSPSTPLSQPPSQVHPIMPETYARYPPQLARRMQADKCYKCQQIGHWSWDCPLKSLSPSAKDHGSCGHRGSEDELLKRMRIMDNFESNSEKPSSMAVSELAEKEGPASSAAPSKGVGSQEFKVADDLHVPDLSWDASVKEQSWLLCALPSFNPIDVPTQVSIGNVPCERSQLADISLSQQTQISTGCDNEVCRDAVTTNRTPASERKPMSKTERQRQVVLFAQQQLLIDLETSDPNEHEAMREAAKATFDMLDNLGVNYKQFSEHVWDYIDLASSMAEMDKSMENSLTLDEYNKHFEEEKVRFARVQDDYFNTETLLEASNQRRQSLIEEISRLEAMLNEKQTRLKSCELENLQIETHLGELRRSLVEADNTLKVTAEEAKIARQLKEKRQAKQISAKTALEKAKLELEN